MHNWGVWGDYDAFDAWLEYRNHSVLPFAGGWLDQPPWIRKAFATFNMVYNLHSYEQELPDIDDMQTTPFKFGLKD